MLPSVVGLSVGRSPSARRASFAIRRRIRTARLFLPLGNLSVVRHIYMECTTQGVRGQIGSSSFTSATAGRIPEIWQRSPAEGCQADRARAHGGNLALGRTTVLARASKDRVHESRAKAAGARAGGGARCRSILRLHPNGDRFVATIETSNVDIWILYGLSLGRRRLELPGP